MCATSADAKPRPGCEAALRLVHATIEDFGLQPLQAYDGLFVMVFGPNYARSRLAARIRDAVAAKNQSTSAYLECEYAERYEGEAVRSYDQLCNGKRLIGEFNTDKFLLIDSFETFTATGFDGEPDRVRLDLLRRILALRVREKRPSLVLFDDPSNLDRHLRGLLDEPKSEISTDRN